MMVTQVSRHLSVGAGEHELVDYLVEHVPTYRREVVVNYYVALKSKRFVVLAGPRDVDKMSLAQGVAKALVGRSSFQWSCFQAHPWWSTHTGAPSHFAIAHARFNALKLNDLLELATAGEKGVLPFFVGIERMTRAEIECYFHDLPRGLLWQADASVVRMRVPDNVYITGTLDVEEKDSLLLAQDISPQDASFVYIGRGALAPALGQRKTSRLAPEWQQAFTRSQICCSAQARTKLARILPDGCEPLALLSKLRRHLGVVDLPPFVLEEAWRYLANAFDDQGRGLFVEPTLENLVIAQDYVLVQNVLPHVFVHRDAGVGSWTEVRECLAPRYPRACAWVDHLAGCDQSERGPAGGALHYDQKKRDGGGQDDR